MRQPLFTAFILAGDVLPRDAGPPPALRLHGGRTMLAWSIGLFQEAGLSDIRVIAAQGQEGTLAEGRLCRGARLLPGEEASGGLYSLFCSGLLDLLEREENPDPLAPPEEPPKLASPAPDAVFAMPVQRGLISPQSIAALMRAWESLAPEARFQAILTPSCGERWGMPFLISSEHVHQLLLWQGGGQWQDQWQWRGGIISYIASFLDREGAERFRQGYMDVSPHEPGGAGGLIPARMRFAGVSLYYLPVPDAAVLGESFAGDPAPDLEGLPV